MERSAAPDERAFREATDQLLPSRTRTAAFTAFAANGLFAVIDLCSLGEADAHFRTVARLAFAPLFVAMMALSTHRWGRRFPQAAVLLLAAVLAIELAVVGSPLPAADSVGFFPALLFFAAFLPLPLFRTGLLAGIFVAAFASIHLWLGHSPAGAVLKHAGNLAAAGAVAVVAADMAEKLRRGEFFAGRQLAAANLRMEELGRVKDQFFTEVSHELRTPLTTALLSLESDAPDPHPAVRPLLRLQKLVDELLELSRVDAGFARPGGQVIDLIAALRPIVDEFSSGFDARRLGLRFAAPEGQAFVRIGPDALEKIAINLLGNALKYTPSGGHVELRIVRGQGSAALEVRDDGPGIGPEQLPHIFDRFARLERPGVAPGTGIGLALAKELTELHGGRLTCESAPGGGCLFRASWPEAAPAEAEAITARKPIFQVAGAVAAALDGRAREGAVKREDGARGPLILIVEDHADLAERIAASLGPGLRTRLAHDGAQGLALARELHPDLIISDVLLPVLSGHDLARKLREAPEGRQTPILLLSALAEPEHVLAGLAAGADDTMAKPFESTMLRARVDALLRLRARRPASDHAILRPLLGSFALALGYDAVALLAGREDGSLGAVAWGGDATPPGPGWERVDAPWVAATDAVRALITRGVPSPGTPAALRGFGAAVAAPIAGAQPPALLVGFTRERRQVAPLELAGLAAAASSLSLLLERERSVIALAQSADEQHRLSAATLSGQDSERRRLAFELHDGIGQTLAAALLHLGLAGRAERAGTDALQTGTALVRQAIDELRGLARDLHPPALAQQGLPLTLHALASSMSSERMLIVSEIQPPAVFDLGPATSLALFRISQAALTNVATHSRARRATLRLRVSPVEAQLEIEDDGVGFHSAQTLHGVGLLGMRERAASLGGTIAIESELGRGTMIRATVPLPGRR